MAFAHLKLIRTAFTIKQYRSSAEPNMFLNLTVNYISKDNQDTFSTVAKLSMKHYGVFPELHLLSCIKLYEWKHAGRAIISIKVCKENKKIHINCVYKQCNLNSGEDVFWRLLYRSGFHFTQPPTWLGSLISVKGCFLIGLPLCIYISFQHLAKAPNQSNLHRWQLLHKIHLYSWIFLMKQSRFQGYNGRPSREYNLKPFACLAFFIFIYFGKFTMESNP